MKEQSGVKERIMNTAGRLFYEQGYLATGINQIIAEAEIAKASLYQHFTSKELLLNEYLQASKNGWWTELDSYIAGMADGREKLEGLFDYRRCQMEKRNFKGCTFARITYELPNLDENSAEVIRLHKLAIKSFMEQQLETIRPSYPKAELKEMTEMLFNLSEGAILQASIFRSSKPLLDVKKIVVKLLSTIPLQN